MTTKLITIRLTGLAIAAALVTVSGQLQAQVPGAPTNLTVSSRGTGRIELSWTAPAGEVSGYVIQFASSSDFNPANPRDVGPTTTFGFNISCKKFFFRIYAKNSAGNGPHSNVVTSDCPCAGPPIAPTNLTVTQKHATNCDLGVDLAWTAPVSAVGCPITGYSAVVKEDGKVFTYGLGLGTSKNLPMKKGVTQTWAIVASNLRGAGQYSNSVTTLCN